MPRQMASTSPEHATGYQNPLFAGSHASTMPYPPHNVFASRYELSGSEGHSYDIEYGKRWSQYGYDFPVSTKGECSSVSVGQSVVAPLSHPESTYGPIGAPYLPPIRIANQSYSHDITRQDYPQDQVLPAQLEGSREEKVVGGVSTHLDYDMDQISDFVSEMAQGMYDLYTTRICLADIDIIRSVHPNMVVSQALRKFVSQILSSTRLPCSTILLGLYYLASRMSMLSAQGKYSAGSGQVYRMLTTALLLGSKFLDDNTFQNRSWSEVSNIPIDELNVLEVEWLLAIDWNLHVNLNDSQGFTSWRHHWANWQAKRVELSLSSLKLTPLDANIRRQRSLNHRIPPSSLCPARTDNGELGSLNIRNHPRPVWHTPHYEQWSPYANPNERSPPSAPETGPNTPDWYGKLGTYGYIKALDYSRAMSHPGHIPSTIRTSAYQIPYSQQNAYGLWNGHGICCGCVYCRSRHDRCQMAPGYGPQSVAS